MKRNIDFNWKDPIKKINFPDGDQLIITRFKSKETIVIDGQQQDQPIAKPQIAMVLLHPKKDEDRETKEWMKCVRQAHRKIARIADNHRHGLANGTISNSEEK